MISPNVNKFCCEDVSLIENYELAIKDKTQTWICHHRLETHYMNGEKRINEPDLLRDDLIKLELYFNRPATELIFLTNKEHAIIHQKTRDERLNTPEVRLKQKEGINKPESKKKMSESRKGYICYNNGDVEILSKTGCPEGFVYGRSKSVINKISKGHKGSKFFNNGKICIRAKECPEGFVPGFLDELKQSISKGHMNQKWFNNGKIELKLDKCPEGFVPGRLPFSKESKRKMSKRCSNSKWYNNGISETFNTICPPGFIPGRLKRK